MSLPLSTGTGTQVDNINWTPFIINVIKAVTFLYKKIIQFSLFLIRFFLFFYLINKLLLKGNLFHLYGWITPSSVPHHYTASQWKYSQN